MSGSTYFLIKKIETNKNYLDVAQETGIPIARASLHIFSSKLYNNLFEQTR